LIGQTISHYRIAEKLGEGGMGVVYKAEDTKLRRTVALKFLRGDVLESVEHKERFLREAQAAAALDHPNICTVHEIDEAEGKTFLALAFVEGQSVKDKIAERPLKLEEALDIAIQTAQGLQAAHEKGIVHRDIKPANLIVNQHGQVKIMDFGLAQLADRTRLTQTAAILGTPAYMSPEQAQRLPADRRSDIWSAGVVLYEMVTGRLPFEGQQDQAVLYAIVHEDYEPVTALRAGLPTELDRVVGKAVARAPAERYQHVDEMLADLRMLQRQRDSPFSGRSVGIQRTRSRRALSIGALAALVVLVGVASWWLSGRLRPDASAGIPTQLRRLTYDSGLTFQGTISADGTLLAYASDRAGEGHLDIWVQQIGGREPIRLTTDKADDSEPNLSPDGRTIIFRSERDGGGLYSIPTLGGDTRLVVSRGRRPRFSPDGNWIAYSVAMGREVPDGAAYIHPFLVAGEARQLGPGKSVASPVWSPDGRSLLYANVRESDWRKHQWWIEPVSKGKATQTLAVEVFKRLLQPPGARIGVGNGFWADEWAPDGFVYFAAQQGDSTDIWRIKIDPTGQVLGGLERVTLGPGSERGVSIARDGSIVFSDLATNHDIWSVPLDANRGVVTGELERLTQGVSSEDLPDLSADGKKLVFRTDRTGRSEPWILDLENGETRSVAEMATDFRAAISPDGSWIAFEGSRVERTVHIVRSEGVGQRRTLTDVVAPWGWSSTSKYLILGRPGGMGLFNVETGATTTLIERNRGTAYQGQFSPDDRWLAFGLGGDLFVASFREGSPIPPDEWVAVAESESFEDKPRWSPDGKLLYLTSDRDGFTCIYAQPVDPATKKPVGAPLEVYHSHQRSLSIANVDPGALEIDVARDKLVFGMAELKGNVWMLEPQPGNTGNR
jgi:Tol biopolymer transport system component/tRNA A-37 threonylcarbamoyl transferase component Bud32